MILNDKHDKKRGKNKTKRQRVILGTALSSSVQCGRALSTAPARKDRQQSEKKPSNAEQEQNPEIPSSLPRQKRGIYAHPEEDKHAHDQTLYMRLVPCTISSHGAHYPSSPLLLMDGLAHSALVREGGLGAEADDAALSLDDSTSHEASVWSEELLAGRAGPVSLSVSLP